MNRKLALSSLVLAAAFAGNAFAEGPLQGNDPFTGTRSRAEVQAELAAFRQAGVDPWAQEYNPLGAFRSTGTRAAVTAQYIAARDLVGAFTGEDSGSAYLAEMHGPALPARVLAGQPQNAQ